VPVDSVLSFQAATAAVWDCMWPAGIASYTKTFSPLERIMRDTMAFPLYNGGILRRRRRQLHDLLRGPYYDPLDSVFGDPSDLVAAGA
jgi:nitroalkane oxidase